MDITVKTLPDSYIGVKKEDFLRMLDIISEKTSNKTTKTDFIYTFFDLSALGLLDELNARKLSGEKYAEFGYPLTAQQKELLMVLGFNVSSQNCSNTEVRW